MRRFFNQVYGKKFLPTYYSTESPKVNIKSPVNRRFKIFYGRLKNNLHFAQKSQVIFYS